MEPDYMFKGATGKDDLRPQPPALVVPLKGRGCVIRNDETKYSANTR
jgi:hypothetical protein